jgi:hypothetical protein
MSMPECNKCDIYGRANCPIHGDPPIAFFDPDLEIARARDTFMNLPKEDPAALEAAAQAILDEQNQPGTREALDRVFRMSEKELGQATIEGARKWRGRPGPFTPRGCF